MFVKPDGLLALLIRLTRHLSPRRRSQGVLLTVLMLFSALAEVLTLGAVLPFLGVLIAPERVFKHAFVAHIAQSWGIDSAARLVLPLTLVFVVAAIVAGAIRLLVLWLSTRLAYSCGLDFSIKVYRRTLYQPYAVHVARNSGEVISNLVNNVNNASGVMLAALMFLSALLMLVMVTLALVAIDPVMALTATIGFGALYRIITWMTARRLNRNSERITSSQAQVIKAVQEGLGGIRDVLLDGTQAVYCAVYGSADGQLRRAHGNNIFIAGSPRFAMESLGMVLLAMLAYFASQKEGGVASALPALGALALGAQRLLPALQMVYQSWAVIAGSRASVVEVLKVLDEPDPATDTVARRDAVKFEKQIDFSGVKFRYAPDAPWVLNGLDLVVRKGMRVGFVGTTGSGKSTAFDLLMGLLEPTEGELLIDGNPLRGNRVRDWQKSIAHVPQAIYLSDATLAENIAFGVPREEIDMQRVREAASQAQINDLVDSRPEGFDALVGERGIRLSGGQRQRIGIARALYKQATVLVFDEATSALDYATEQSVMQAIQGLSHDLTILLIAHRLSTVQRCDLIVEIGQGRVVAQGTYQQLMENSASFRRMANATP
jgi:ABC-type multidrug transport system fused ATPase/permease subunit